MHQARIAASDAPREPSATSTRKIGSDAQNQPPALRARGIYRLPASRRTAIFREPALARFSKVLRSLSAQAESSRRAACSQAELAGLVQRLAAKAESEKWSLRKLAREVRLPWTTWHRLMHGRAPVAPLLPVVRSAAQRLRA